MLHEHEESDPAIGAAKPANDAVSAAEERVEPRAGAKGNAREQSTSRPQSRESVSQALDRVRPRPCGTWLCHDAAGNRARRGLGKPETFNFLGFTPICGTSRRGKFLLERKSRRDRVRIKLREIKDALRRRMHQPIPEQGKWLGQVVNGFFGCHAVPTNSRTIGTFRYDVKNLWRRTLRRRSQKDSLTWAQIARLADRWLPKPLIRHPWPSTRFAVKHPRWKPDALIGPVRFCAGGAG